MPKKKKIPGVIYCSECQKPIGEKPGDHIKAPCYILKHFNAEHGLEKAKLIKCGLLHPECYEKLFLKEEPVNPNIKLYKRAIRVWGIEPQLLMVAEELNELGVEVCKLIRAGNQPGVEIRMENLVDEIADVEIMIDQMKFLYSLNLRVELQKDKKLRRLKERLDSHEKELPKLFPPTPKKKEVNNG